MRTQIIDFKERTIRREYSACEIEKDLIYDLDIPLKELEIKIQNLLQDEIVNHKEHNVWIKINLLNSQDIEIYEIINLLNIIAKLTITGEDLKIGYLSTPLWFKDRVSLPAATQRDLGNYKNIFSGLQITIFTDNSRFDLVE